MYPQFDVFGITLYSFGLGLSLSFLAFFFLLYRLSLKLGINTQFFLGNALFFFLSSFLFSRFFYIIAEWRDLQFIFSEGIIRFFLMSDYNFSLIGGIFGFLFVLFIAVWWRGFSLPKYIDATVIAFLGAASVGFVGAFFGGQVLGAPTDLSIGVEYTSPYSANPYADPVIPLGLLYALFSFLLFSLLYIVRSVVSIDGIVGYFGMITFSAAYIAGEQFSGREDIVASYTGASLGQIGFLILIIFAVW